MKTKVLFKKLALGKQTIANLENAQLKRIHGGIDDVIDPEPDLSKLQIYCTCTCGGCPTECTCGTGDPLCNCVSR